MAGQLVHFEIPANDTSEAQEFWGSLFGWKFEPFGGVEYYMTQVSDSMGGAITSMEQGRQGARAYFDVDDIDAGIARVKELGGEAGDRAPVPGMGWFAVCKDTEGNDFGLWQSDTSAPAPAG